MKRLSLIACTVLPVLAMGLSAANAGKATPQLSFPEGVELGIKGDGIDRSNDLATLKKRMKMMDRFPYVVRMSDDPVIAYDGNIAGFKATRPKKGKKVNPNSALVRKYQKFLERKHNKALAAIGATEKKIYGYTIALNGFSALMTAEDAKALAKQPGVLSVKRDELRQPLTDNSPAFLGLTDPGGAYEKGFSGEGVVVGIIDTGIWPEHPSFTDDGSYAAPPVTVSECDFGNAAHNPSDAAYTCNNKLIGARSFLDVYRAVLGLTPTEYDSARDDNGHGSHTASTAAGNANVSASVLGIDRGMVSGIAPRAHVVAYKALGDLGGFGADLLAAIDQAVADGVDVINYSIGGGASLTGPDDIAFLFAADAGVFVATSAGNSGPEPSTVGGPGSVPWITTVAASTQDRTFEGSALLGSGAEVFGASITHGTGVLPLIDAEFAGGDLCLPGTLDPIIVSGKIVLCRRGVIGRVEKSLAVYQAGGAGMILYNNVDEDNEFTDTHWVPSVHVDNTEGLAVKAYIGSDSPAATAKIEGGIFTPIPGSDITYFSSRGPNPVAGDIIKPDVTAPGIAILAGNTPTPQPGTVPGQLFQAIAGTSMSSPHVAGVFALLKEAHPDWTPAMAKSALMTTARQDVYKEDRVTPADPFDMGAGHIAPAGNWNQGSVVEPGLAYDAGVLDYLGFLCDAEPSGLSNPAATCALLQSIGIPTDASDLNLPSIGSAEVPGSDTIIRTVTSVAKESGWRTYTPSIDAPPGYSVSISPSTISLKKGQSAAYEITVTNDGSAPVGEWRFGSLTWNDGTGNYHVRSPIAVRGVLYDAPDKLEGAGSDGSLSFDVKFGYTGAYAAAPHGFVPAVVTIDTVVQDPDQTFDPNDGFSNLHQLNLSGTAYVRWALPPEATEPEADLDLFVLDPNGDLVASSTKGGTDELIDIPSPMDGTWSIYVHGWSTPGGDSDYDLSSWQVPLTSGGSFSVDAAPTTASSGTVGTVDASWAALAADTHYLGAVSHTGNGGLMGFTLVDVTVP